MKEETAALCVRSYDLFWSLGRTWINHVKLKSNKVTKAASGNITIQNETEQSD